MKIKDISIFSLLGISLAFTLLTVSCVDDIIPTEEPGSSEIPTDGYGLALQVALQSLPRDASAASFETDENYINPKKLSLLFFNADYKDDKKTQKGDHYDELIHQFMPSDLTFIPIRSTEDGTLTHWYVRIKEFPSGFESDVKEQDFKVVVLANWPNIPEFRKGDHISQLHHLTDLSSDPYFKDKPDEDEEEDPASKYEVYKFLLDDKFEEKGLGLYTDWVQFNSPNEFKTITQAKDYIKKIWKPGGEFFVIPTDGRQDLPQLEKRGHKDLRCYWNFNGAYYYRPSNLQDDDYEYNPEGDYESFAKAWAESNYNDLNAWLDAPDAATKLENLSPCNSNNSNFEYVHTEEGYQESSVSGHRYEDNGKIGIALPSSDDINVDERYLYNVIRLNLVSSGSINIKWKSIDGGNLILESRNQRISGKPTQTEEYVAGKDAVWKRKITGDSEFLTIYAKGGKVVIYDIDYIRDEYLYEIDRSGIAVSEDNPIPMYGVETYEKLKDYWQPGTLFNLSDFNHISSIGNYENKEVYLLRSVAKVELKIPKSLNAHNVYLRSQNRKARCEPMDVSTSTRSVWKDETADKHQETDGCEWFMLKKQPPFYKGNASLDNYQNRLAWFYGGWTTDGKNLNGIKIESPAEKIDDYPKIMNPLIERSDFTQFIYTGEADGIYDRYVLYVPEKFIDDPNNVGFKKSNGSDRIMVNEEPKVCHIEFRLGKVDNDEFDTDPHDNIDDNNCYRIYFTEKGYNADYKPSLGDDISADKDNPTGTKQTWENTYEQNPENLAKHWPIMRNHVYSFTVEDVNSKIVIIRLEVVPWKNIDVPSFEW